MDSLVLEISLILVLLLANGMFAMTEIAIVSSRRGILQAMAERGNRGAERALDLAANPNRFLSTVQVGITLVGIFSGAFGGVSIAVRLSTVLAPLPYVGPYASQVSFALVIGLLTFLTLVIGELVPKRLAMAYPESIASTMSGMMAGLSRLAAPVVVLLSKTTSAVIKLLRINESEENKMSREEFTVLVREGLITGSTDPSETRMIEGVFKFENLDVYDIMIPRTRISWIERDAKHEDVWPMIVRCTQEAYPIYHDQRDNLVGVVFMKDIYAHLAAGAKVSFQDLMQAPMLVPETQKASSLLDNFRTTGHRVAFVVDEFGSIVGMVTLIDLMESIVGDVPSKEELLAMPVRQRPDGSWLVDGLFEIEKLPEHLEGFQLPEGGGDEYQTVAGWVTLRLARMPREGDIVSDSGWTFEIIDMDGPRVDKLLAVRESEITASPGMAAEDNAGPTRL